MRNKAYNRHEVKLHLFKVYSATSEHELKRINKTKDNEGNKEYKTSKKLPSQEEKYNVPFSFDIETQRVT